MLHSLNDIKLLESIKVLDGEFINLNLHQARMNRTFYHFFKEQNGINISDYEIPPSYRKGLVKCRLVYSLREALISYEAYSLPSVKNVTLIDDNQIDYMYKSLNREHINQLFAQRGQGDDILIVKNGYITDTSICNVVFENQDGLFTPSTCLLAGTKRQSLLNSGVIRVAEISLDTISKYKYLYLINAMIDLEDALKVNIKDLIY